MEGVRDNGLKEEERDYNEKDRDSKREEKMTYYLCIIMHAHTHTPHYTCRFKSLSY